MPFARADTLDSCLSVSASTPARAVST